MSSWFLVLSMALFSHENPFSQHLTSFFPDNHTVESLYLKQKVAQNMAMQEQASDTESGWLMLSVKTLSPLILQKGEGNQENLTLKNHEAIRHALQFDTALMPIISQILDGSETIALPSSNHQPSLYPYRYLLTLFNLANLPHQLAERWQEYQLGLVVNKTWLLADPSYQWLDYLKELSTQSRLDKPNGWWQVDNKEGVQSLFLLKIVPTSPNLAVLKTTFTRLFGANNYQVSGSQWVAFQAEKEIKQTVSWVSGLALLMVILSLIVAFRNIKLVFISFLPILSAFTFGLAVVIFWFGSIELITLAMASVLLGVAVDYPIHTISSYQAQARKPGSNKQPITKVWKAIKLGSLTSAFGFFMLVWVPVEGIQQLAIFSASGLLAALLTTASLKPWLAVKFSSHETAVEQVIKTERVSLKMFSTNPTKSSIGFYWIPPLAIFGFVLLFKPIIWQDDIASLSPVSASLITTDRALRSDFNVEEVGKQLLLVGKDIESLLQIQERTSQDLERLKKQGTVHDYKLLANLLPSQYRQQQHQKILPTERELQQALSQAVTKTGFKAKHFQAWIKAMDATRQLTPLQFSSSRFQESAGYALAKTLLYPMLIQGKHKWVMVVPLVGVTDDSEIQEWVESQNKRLSALPLTAIHGADDARWVYFNQRALVAHQLQDMRWILLKSFLVVWLALMVVIWLATGSFQKMVKVLLPVGLGIGFTFSVYAILAIEVTIFHLMSFMLVAAIGVDYGLLQLVEEEDSQAGYLASQKAINVAFMTTFSSFLILALSPLSLLNAIGLTVLLGVSFVYILSRLLNTRNHF